MTVPRADSTIAARVKKLEDELRRIKIAASITQSAVEPAAVAKNSLWLDSSAGNEPKVFDGTAWVPVRDETIAVAQTTATTAQTTADTAQTTADTAQTTATAAQSDASTALDKFPIVATDITDGAISTPKLSANAIDGMTITGALIRTAASGRRIEIDSASAANEARFYSSEVGEVSPGLIEATAVTGSGQLRLVSPEFSSGTAELILQSHPSNATLAQVTADEVQIKANGTSQNVFIQSLDGALDLQGWEGISLTSGSGQVTIGLQDVVAIDGPYWYGYLSASQSIPTSGVAAKVTGWVADGSPNSSGITHSSGNFTLPRDGRYRLRVQTWWAAAASPTGPRTAQWVKSPSTVVASHTVPGNSATQPMPVYAEKTRRFASDDVVFVQVIQGQASPHNLIGSTPDITYVQIEWVGP